jgi:hypothetical protein
VNTRTSEQSVIDGVKKLLFGYVLHRSVLAYSTLTWWGLSFHRKAVRQSTHRAWDGSRRPPRGRPAQRGLRGICRRLRRIVGLVAELAGAFGPPHGGGVMVRLAGPGVRGPLAPGGPFEGARSWAPPREIQSSLARLLWMRPLSPAVGRPWTGASSLGWASSAPFFSCSPASSSKRSCR